MRHNLTRLNFQLPHGLKLANYRCAHRPSVHFHLSHHRRHKPHPRHGACRFNAGLGEGTEARDGEDIDGTLTWADVAWLRSVTSLPLVVKGVMTPEDTTLAAKAGCVHVARTQRVAAAV